MKSIRSKISKLSKDANIPGLSIAVISNKKITLLGSVGVRNNKKRVTKNTVYLAASLSKPVFAYGVLKLVERGELDLDKPLFTYLKIKEIDKRFKKDKRYKKITARMVLSHTSGLTEDPPNKILFTPGKKFSYSGEGYLYLQQVVEKISGLSTNDFMIKEVFKPLNMNNSSYIYKNTYNNLIVSPHNEFGEKVKWFMDLKKIKRAHVAGSLFTTAEDYAKFLIGLSKDIYTHMLKTQIKITKKIYWGLGVGLEYVNRKKMLWHWGDSQTIRNFVSYEPKRGNGFVLFTNSANGLAILDELTTILYKRTLQSTLSLEKVSQEKRYLHEQYDNPLRINRLKVYYAFITKGVNIGLEKFIKWEKTLSKNNKDQIEVLIERFSLWGFPENKKFVKAIMMNS